MPNSSHHWLILFTLTLVSSISVFHIFAMPWSQDEGLYLLVAQRIANGEAPYRDFAFQQMPLYPYLLIAWQAVFHESLISARLFSLGWIALLLVIVYLFLKKYEGSRRVAWCFPILLLTHPLAWDYSFLVKPHALSLSCTLTGIFLALKTEAKNGRQLLIVAFFSGIFLGISANTRLIFMIGPLVGLFLLRGPWKMFLAYGLGLLLTSLPTLWALWSFADEAIFNWVRYHQFRGDFRFDYLWRSLHIAFSHLAWISFLLVGLASFSTFIKKNSSPKIVWLFFLLAALNTLPLLRLVPLYDEYFLPFLFFSLLGIFLLLPNQPLARFIVIAATLLSVLFWIPAFQQDLRALMAPPAQSPINAQKNVALTAQAIMKHSKPDDEVLAWWNGYIFASHRKVMPGMGEGLAVLNMHGKLSASESRKYLMARVEDVQSWVDNQRPPLIVVGVAAPPGFESLVQTKYRLIEEAGRARLYVPEPKY